MLGTLLHLLILLVLLPVCGFAPGFFILRRVRRLTIDETINGSIAISLTILYLLATAIYLLKLNWHFCWVSTAVFAGTAFLSRRELRSLWSHRRARQQFAAFAALLSLAVLFLALIQHYSGGAWANDWMEHYERTTFFLKRQPYDTIFLGQYILPARPPMSHLMTAYFLAQSGGGFGLFQVIFSFLNVLTFFPCVLLAGLLIPMGGRRIWIIAAILATSPVFMENSTYAWNKLGTAYFVILSIALYLRGWQKPSPARIVASAGSMAAALLVHYSAGPYAVFLGIHYLCVFFWRKAKLYEVAGSAIVVILLLSSWFGWAIAIYKVDGTFKSNTTVADSSKQTVRENLGKIGDNLYTSTVPYPLRTSSAHIWLAFEQPNRFGYVRDWFFTFTQNNLLGSIGLIGVLVAIYLAVRFSIASQLPLRIFWATFVPFSIIAGIAVHGTADTFGVAHVCLQPLTCIALTLLAAGLLKIRSLIVRGVLVSSILIQVILGIVLQFRMEMLPIKAAVVDQSLVIPPTRGLLNLQAVRNSAYRFQAGISFVSDSLWRLHWLILPLALVLLGLAIVYLAAVAISSERMTQPGSGKWKPFAFIIACLYAMGTIAVISDRQLGFTVSDKLPFSLPPTNEQYMERINAVTRARDANRDDPEIHYATAVEYYQFGQYLLACREASDALLLNPDHERAHYLLGMMTQSQSIPFTLDVGGTVYDRTYTQSPVAYLAYGAFTYMDRNYKQRGKLIIEQAAEAFPKDAEIRSSLGVVLYEAGDKKRGIEEAERAVTLNPASLPILRQLRDLLAGQGVSGADLEQRLNDARAGKIDD